MLAHRNRMLTIVFVMLLLGITGGCVSMCIGDAVYTSGTIVVPVTNTREPGDAYVQITVYQLKNFEQQEFTVLNTPVTLRSGENRVIIPVNLEPGQYKLYIYLIRDGERQTAVIRDITV
jgi:hypothetical protein